MDRVRGCMWITGRTRWHCGLYCPPLACYGAEFTLHIVDRDDDYIEQMEPDLIAFSRLVASERRLLERLRLKVA